MICGSLKLLLLLLLLLLLAGMFIGYRPYPADGYPVLGWAGDSSNVYVAGEGLLRC
jgi:glycine/D-amino acid oxidase-like deaminating enzyme